MVERAALKHLNCSFEFMPVSKIPLAQPSTEVSPVFFAVKSPEFALEPQLPNQWPQRELRDRVRLWLKLRSLAAPVGEK